LLDLYFLELVQRLNVDESSDFFYRRWLRHQDEDDLVASFFDGKLAYITGGSSGIGLSAAGPSPFQGGCASFARTPERVEAALKEVWPAGDFPASASRG